MELCYMQTGTARQLFRLTTSVVTFFASAKASVCNHDQATYFTPSITQISYQILRYCDLGQLGGGSYVDKVMNSLARSCGAIINDGESINYDILANWFDATVEFYRGRGHGNLSIFEGCISSLFNQAQSDYNYDQAAGDRWTTNAIYILLSLLFLSCVAFCTVGYISEQRSKQKKAAAQTADTRPPEEQIEEIVIPVLAPGELDEKSDLSKKANPVEETSAAEVEEKSEAESERKTFS